MQTKPVVHDRHAALSWISAEIERHKAAIRALEGLRNAPDVLVPLLSGSYAMTLSVPDVTIVRGPAPVGPGPDYSGQQHPDEGFPLADHEVADAIAKAIPVKQKARIATLVERLNAAGTLVSTSDVERALKRFPERFAESSRGWWAVTRKGGKHGQES